MGFKDFLKGVGMGIGVVKGKFDTYELEFDLNASIETVEANENKFVSAGSAWTLEKKGSASRGVLEYIMYLASMDNENIYRFTKTSEKSCKVYMKVFDHNQKRCADILADARKKELLKLEQK